MPLPGLDHLLPTAPPERVARAVPSSSTLSPSASAIARFWRRVVFSPTCWFWVGAISVPDGYGRFTWQRAGVQRTLSAHRFALLISGQSIDNRVAEHYCNEPLCVRVGELHVFASTQSANLTYAVELGRHRGNIRAVGDDESVSSRSMSIRNALARGWDEDAYQRAISGHRGQSALF